MYKCVKCDFVFEHVKAQSIVLRCPFCGCLLVGLIKFKKPEDYKSVFSTLSEELYLLVRELKKMETDRDRYRKLYLNYHKSSDDKE